MPLFNDPAYRHMTREEQLALRDRLDDYTPADFLDAFPAYAERVDEQAARRALYPAGQRDVTASTIHPPVPDERAA